MRRLALAIAAFCFATPAWAEGERAGDFDYYVMSLSWSSNWCALTGDARGDPQCQPGRGLTWVLHGLWPQKEQGWPSYCRTGQRDPTRAETAAMADIMGGSGLAFYQWKKHGRCAGLSAPDFYKTARAAHDSIALPPVFARIRKDMRLPASVIEDAFLEANPGLTRDEITVTCDQGMIQEVRICLTKDLSPRPCAPDSARDCQMKDAELDAVR
jgi:ribonuclease T2